MAAAATLSEPRVRRGVLRELGSRRTTYRPFLDLSLRYCNDTGIYPPGSETEAVSEVFMHVLR